MDAASSNAGVALFLMIAVSSVALFSFLAVAVWTAARRKERETYYKAEMMKRIAELGGDQSPALTYLREEEKISAAKRLAGFRLGGLVNLAIGLALMILLHSVAGGSGVYLVGLFPLFVGVALLVYGFWLSPKMATD